MNISVYEEVHEPPKKNCAEDHGEEQEEKIFNPVFPGLSPDQSQDNADEQGIQDHGEKMALEDHDFFPRAISKASKAIRKLRSPAPAR